MYTLRPYQQQCVDNIINNINRKIFYQYVVMATGLGKTVCFANLPKKIKGKTLVIAHREELLTQALNKIKSINPDLNVEIEQADKIASSNCDVVIASVQTIGRKNSDRIKKFNPSEFGLILTDECFTPDVEILTENGFVRFDELKENIKVAQYNKNTSEISYVIPTKYIKHRHNGEMINFHNIKTIDITLTKNHKMLLCDNNYIDADKLKTNSFIPVCGNACGPDDKLTSTEKLMIMLQADGYIGRKHSAQFCFIKQRKIDEFLKLMEEGSFKYSEIKATGKKQGTRRFIVMDIKNNTKLIRQHIKISNISFNKAREIIEYMVKWDGSIISDTFYYYSSVVKDNVDFYQEVAILAGYKSYIGIEKDDRKETFSDVYRLYINKKIDRICTQKRFNKEYVDYNGYVYCVDVPHENIIVRRNGRPLIIGNCHHSTNDSYYRILEYFGCLKNKTTNPNSIAVIGFTATPGRADNKGMEEIFDIVAFKMDILDGIRQGYLANIKAFTVSTQNSLDNVGSLGGDFMLNELSSAVNTKSRNRLIVESYKNICNNDKALVFSVDVQHAYDIQKEFIEQGYKAEVVIGLMDKEERQNILNKYKTDELNIVINCQVLTEGYDNEYIKTILLARPTKSTGLYMQMIGRGTRLSPSKDHMKIIDFADNISKHNIITCSSIIGIDCPIRFDGQDILQAKDSIERLVNTSSVNQDLFMLDLNKIEERIAEVDIFNQAKLDPLISKYSKFSWTRTPFGFSLSLGTDKAGCKITAKVSPDELNIYNLSLYSQHTGNMKIPPKMTSISQLTFGGEDEEFAIKKADKLITMKFPNIYNLAGQHASWRSEPATEKQLSYLKKLGYKNTEKLDKGQASILLSKHFDSKK